MFQCAEMRLSPLSSVYDLREIARHAPEMTPDGMAFLAILSGADYGHGIKGLGVELVSGLLRAGFHEPLLTAIREYSGARQEEALRCWREAIRLELRTNASGKLKSRRPAAAADFPSDFPDLATANAYLNPATSYTTAHFAELSHDFKGRIDVPALVAFFTEKFDWNHAEILDKVKNGLRRSLIMREFSDLIEGGMRENDVSSAPFFVEVPRRTTAQRTSKDTDETPETRLQLAHEKPWPFLKQAERALVHPDPNIGKADEWRAKDAARNGIELPQTTGDYVSKHKDDGRIWISTDLLKLSATGRRLIAEREQSKASPKKRAPLKNSSSLASASSVSPVKSRAGKMPSSSQASIVTISSEMNEDEGMAERSFQASRRRSITPKASSSTLSSNTSSQSTIRSKASTSYTTVLSDDELPSLDHHACVHKSGVAPKSPRKSKKHVSAHAVIDLISDSEDDSMPLRASPGKRARSAEAKLAQPILPFVATRGGKGKVKARATSPKDLLGATRTSPTMMGGSSHGCKRPSVVIDLD